MVLDMRMIMGRRRFVITSRKLEKRLLRCTSSTTQLRITSTVRSMRFRDSAISFSKAPKAKVWDGGQYYALKGWKRELTLTSTNVTDTMRKNVRTGACLRYPPGARPSTTTRRTLRHACITSSTCCLSLPNH